MSEAIPVCLNGIERENFTFTKINQNFNKYMILTYQLVYYGYCVFVFTVKMCRFVQVLRRDIGWLYTPLGKGSCKTVISIVTGVQAGRSGVKFLPGTRDFSVLQHVHTDSASHPTSYLMGTWVHSQCYSGRGVKLYVYLHSVLRRLRVGGVICSLYAFVTAIWTT
jgi:hypothetical protein